MADAKELAPKSFRITDATAQRFKEIASELGSSNQQETMAKLIEAYEFQSGKIKLKEKSADIEQFERYTIALSRMFMKSLEDNMNVTETVRTEFDAQLQSKDTVIQDLQGQLTVSVQLKEEAVAKAKALTDTNAALNTEIKEMQEDYSSHVRDLTSSIQDKDNLNRALMETCNELKIKVADMSDDHEKLLEFKQEIADLKSKLKAAEQDKENSKKALDQVISDHTKADKEHEKRITELKAHESESLERLREQMQVLSDKAVIETEKKYQQQIQTLKDKQLEEINQYQQNVDQYQKKYLEVLERFNNTIVQNQKK